MEKQELHEGAIIKVYEDWQLERNPIGIACLTKFKREGLTFIIKDSCRVSVPSKTIIYDEPYYDWEWQELPLGQYTIYDYERWDCYLIKSFNPRYGEGKTYSLNIRFAVGEFKDSNIISSRKRASEITEDTYIAQCIADGQIIDKFMKVNGIEIF